MEQPTGLTYQGKPRTCGFRLSHIDVAVLLVSALIGVGGFSPTYGFSVFVPFVVVHFFLFCNVFRIRRKPELVWGACFLLNCIAWIASGHVNIFAIIGTQFVVTVVIIANELRMPSYHGVLARRINPRIDDYLAGRI